MARPLLIAAALLAVFLCSPAAAQQTACGPYSDVTARLQNEYAEQLYGRGIDAIGRMLEIWAGPTGWTVLAVQPSDMLACVMLVGRRGTEWQTFNPKKSGRKADGT